MYFPSFSIILLVFIMISSDVELIHTQSQNMCNKEPKSQSKCADGRMVSDDQLVQFCAQRRYTKVISYLANTTPNPLIPNAALNLQPNYFIAYCREDVQPHGADYCRYFNEYCASKP